MELVIRIRLDNDAFKSQNDVPRILNRLAYDCAVAKLGDFPIRLMDINGNTVGGAKVVK